MDILSGKDVNGSEFSILFSKNFSERSLLSSELTHIIKQQKFKLSPDIVTLTQETVSPIL